VVGGGERDKEGGGHQRVYCVFVQWRAAGRTVRELFWGERGAVRGRGGAEEGTKGSRCAVGSPHPGGGGGGEGGCGGRGGGQRLLSCCAQWLSRVMH